MAAINYLDGREMAKLIRYHGSVALCNTAPSKPGSIDQQYWLWFLPTCTLF